MTKLQKMGFIHSPDSWDELMDWIDRFSTDQRPYLITAAGMGYNMAIDKTTSTKKESTNG